ncbi:dephospho-CoA kinase [Sinosporangium siamense]|uniref:dephospho-CoA kinase n=1 Tax=Sinosporangium siamense TaxID=1367973 RepID=UPI0019527CE3|nr:dephospho-CoA kinase [Sinosporangium siamense]
MLKVGLTGGIGSGKSEVSRRLSARGAVVIDADKIAREVVEPGTPGLSAVVAEFGPEILREDGSLNREKLGSIVFADQSRLKALNAIVHPLVGTRAAELQQAAPADAIVVYDVPLLVENNLASMYDLVVVVDAADETRVERLMKHRNMPEPDARARLAAQAPRETRLAAADLVIDNEGPLEDLDPKVDTLWTTLVTRRSATSS